MSDTPHARAFDLPGWPCPPRVRDIANHEDNWGWVPIWQAPLSVSVAVDEVGFLWANGDVEPKFKLPSDGSPNPGALLCWTPDGLGLWVHPLSMKYLPGISRLDMRTDQWVPVAVALTEWPPHIKAS